MAEDLLVEFVGEKVKKELLAQVQDSIREEEAAIDVYRRRADYCRRGYPKIAEIYDHVREEEEHHLKEFQDMAEGIRQLETK
jgi:rubrerythrin